MRVKGAERLQGREPRLRRRAHAAGSPSAPRATTSTRASISRVTTSSRKASATTAGTRSRARARSASPCGAGARRSRAASAASTSATRIRRARAFSRSTTSWWWSDERAHLERGRGARGGRGCRCVRQQGRPELRHRYRSDDGRREARAARRRRRSQDGGVVTATAAAPASAIRTEAAIRSTARRGCCTADGTCLPGTAPAQCGKGGLVCMNCAAVGYGCVSQGCARGGDVRELRRLLQGGHVQPERQDAGQRVRPRRRGVQGLHELLADVRRQRQLPLSERALRTPRASASRWSSPRRSHGTPPAARRCRGSRNGASPRGRACRR